MEPTSAVWAEIHVVYYMKAAFLTLLVYDTLLQLNEEYLHVWRSRWTLIKFLYLWTRYSTFVGTVGPLAHLAYASPLTCDGVTAFTFIFSVVGIGVAEMILMIRTYTLYERSKKLLVFFFVMWSSLCGIVFWAVTEWGTNLQAAFSHQKITNFWRSMYCDGLWFYLAILPFTTATVICLYVAPPGLSELFDCPVQVMHSILCCRLITHARDVAAEEDRREAAINRVFKGKYSIDYSIIDISPHDDDV
ncbi:hypothetical protein GGX14DRAFT_568511 [Mycena pura]|uniref:DUF6533 domain-containing protein n=1 Tax=Mycena pura TaxID=153505 RepID=A0AAD6YES5_9AGAR|nr:hypothetical protein GGX14DRAFT_568511 [Mycena pura]